MQHVSHLIAVTALAGILSACGSSDKKEDTSTSSSSVSSGVNSTSSTVSSSSSSATAGGFEASISDFITYADWDVVDYSTGRSNPGGLGDAHQAGNDHFTRKTFMNELAKNSTGEFTEGSIIVKETFTYTMGDDGWEKTYAEAGGLLAMVKRGGGFNSDHNGWEWFMLSSDLSSVIAQGDNLMEGACNACHSKAASQIGGMDYSFPKPTEFVAEPSIFADYQNWDLIEFDTAPDNLSGSAHIDDADLRRVYQKQVLANPSEAGEMGYPVGTVLVKDITKDDEIKQVVAMVKRGGNFDAANGNWEYFMLDPSDPTVIAKMEGNEVRGAVAMCIGCHSKAKDDTGTDFVFKHSNAPFNTNTEGEYVATKSMLSNYTSWQVSDYTIGITSDFLGGKHGSTNAENARLVFENTLAAAQSGTDDYAQGSTIVKEVFTTKDGEKEFAGTFAMVKRGGNYNPDGAGWEWFNMNSDNMVVARGQLAGCIGCHAKATDANGVDYTFTKPSEFVGTLDDIKDYKSWTKVDEVTGDNLANGGAHSTSGTRKTYKKQASASPYTEAGEYPIGTIIVKEITNTAGSITNLYAMIKRGGSFNVNGGGWEWFTPSTDLSSAGSLGAGSFCAGCHGKAGDTTQTDASFLGADYVFYKKDDPVPMPVTM
ncbi:cytochrome P460 family protein [Marinagarivorans algicola]|uniref:cytochrome P460 family protein n=1 Tax=Marinagarivorans algicola TaxID=1513270 RepID=UPI0006B46725|nr:cytochrome P460 family protein [Marinagarivorans algicola]